LARLTEGRSAGINR